MLLIGLLSMPVSRLVGQDPSVSSATGSKSSSSERERHYAVFGGGCFWCIEAVFERVLGVQSVESGYAGGTIPNPTYEMVSTDQTGHAEVCRIEFDPEVISYEDLVRIFFKSHDPTLLNSQGPDHGTRYRSVILYADEEQKKSIEGVLEEFRKKRTFRGRVYTEISPLQAFYRAEEYHQDYFAKHPEKPYCEINIRPKIGKFERSFKEFSKVQKDRNDKKSKNNPSKNESQGKQ